MPRHGTGRRRTDPNATQYILKVALEHDRDTWRRIAIRSDQTLDHLHAAIFDAFDRFDEHLYSFYIPPVDAGSLADIRDAPEYTSPNMLEDIGGPFEPSTAEDASATTIGSLELTTGRELVYLFDFGDEWWHHITVENTDDRPGRGRYPRVIEKQGDSPPQYPDLEDDDEDWDEEDDEDEEADEA